MRFAAERGEPALRLALHAAVPQGLRPHLLHLLRLNFVPEASWVDESDVLLAPFCDDVGNGFYQLDPDARRLLLDQLDPTFPEEHGKRSWRVADFLATYVESCRLSPKEEQDRLTQDFLAIEAWVALAFRDPDHAAAQLAAALERGLQGEIATRVQFRGLSAALSVPLATYPTLLTYAAGVEALEDGRSADAVNLLERLPDKEIHIGGVALRSPRSLLNIAKTINIPRAKILIVDNSHEWLLTVQRILGEKYELELTTEPAEAVSLMKSTFFMLAILDQRISVDVSGIDLLGQLRAIQYDLRAIILTGYADLDDAVKSMKVGAYDYISKGRHNLASELLIRVERALAEASNLAALIEKGENAGLEFKSSLRWDLRQNKVNKDLEGVIIRTVAAFFNSEMGGVLLIGVDDSGKVVGLQHDYKALKKQDRDGFQNHLISLLLSACGKDVSPLIRVDFHELDGNDVCRVSVKPAPRPVFSPDGNGGEYLFIRAGNSTRQLNPRETVEYCKMRWK